MTIILDPPPYVLAGQVTSSVIGFSRVPVGRSSTVSVSLANSSGDPANPSPDSATVQIVRFSDGAELANTAGTDTGVGTFSFPLTPAHTSQLDYLLASWTATIDGYEQTITQVIEVCGGFLFSIADLRTLEPFGNATKFPTATLSAARTMAEQALEDACGVAFVPRYHRESTASWDGRNVLLSFPRPLTVRALSLDSTAWTQDQLDTIRIDRTGLLYLNSSRWCQWGTVSSEVVVDYEHGHSTVPLRVARAAMLLVRAWLVSGPVDDRAATFSSVDGGTYSLVTAGRAGSAFGLPEVDAVVQQYGMQAGVA